MQSASSSSLVPRLIRLAVPLGLAALAAALLLSTRALDLALDGEGRVEMNRGPGGQWRLDWLPFRRSIEVRSIQGMLDGAVRLEAAVQRASGPAGLAVLMAEALQWDLDFARDLRRGDSFKAMYEAVQLDGKDRAAGKLLALVYEDPGRTDEGYTVGDRTGLYD